MTSAADVTVVMPAKNRSHLIGRALGSVSAQTIAPRQVVVVDDGSTDDTGDVARAHGARVITFAAGGGSGPARNAGIEAASTEWVAFLDSDDEWLPDHLARLLGRAEGHVLVTAPGRSTSGRIMGNPWRTDVVLDPLTLLAPGDLVCTSGTVVRRSSLLQAGLFRPLRRAQDLDMWLRVLETGSGLAVPGVGFLYHEHVHQVSRDKDLMRQCFDQIMDEYAERPWLSTRAFDASYSRIRWDDLRAAQRSGDVRGVLRDAGWFVHRPHAFPALVRLLRQRRASRRGEA